MIVFKCLNCRTRVVNLDNERPRSCAKCHSGPAWMYPIANDSGPLGWTDAAHSSSTARWTPDRLEDQ